MSRSPEVLVALPSGEGIVERDGRRVLTPDVGSPHGAVLDGDRVEIVGLRDGRTLVGGMLPRGATAAVAVDVTGTDVAATCARGAWVTVVDAGPHPRPSPVRFLDAAGEIVRPGRTRGGEPVADAITPCPACGALGWTRRGRTIACDRCGHAVDEGGWIEADEPDEVDERERRRADRFLEAQERRVRRMLAQVAFPVFVLSGAVGRPAVSGWGGGDRGVRHLSILHDGVTVDVDTDPHRRHGPDHAAREAIESVLRTDPEWPELSRPALTLWLRARGREVAALAAAATTVTGEVTLDGVPHPATFAVQGRAWAAVIDRDDLRVTVTATERDRSGIALRTAADPVSEIDAGFPR